MPFVAVFGTSVDQSLMSIILASLAVSVIWLMLKKTGVKGSKVCGLQLFWFWNMFLVYCSYRKMIFLFGLLLGFAALSRLPAALAFPFFCF